MNKFCIILMVLAAVGCTPAASTAEIVPTKTAAPFPTFTLMPTATLPPTATVIPSITPTATLEPAPFVYDIDPGVPGTDEAEIKLGIDLVRAYVRDFLGGDISSSIQPFTIKIAADGKGNDGSCCTALAESGPRPFFDVKHSNWNISSSDYWTNTDNHMNAGAHEYAHAWQSSLGCMTIHFQPLGDWLNEGLAQYISINTLKHNGYVTEEEYQTLLSVAYTRTRFENLAAYERNSPHWAGDIGFVAVNELVSMAPKGELSIRTVCENIASGRSVDQAFTSAFGISKNEFYQLFADYQKTYIPPTSTPVPAGMVAVNGTVVLAQKNQHPEDYVVSFCNVKVEQCLPGNMLSKDGKFSTYLDPGEYKISVNPLNGGESLGWYTKIGLVPTPNCGETVKVNDGEELNLAIDFHPVICPKPTPAAGMTGVQGKVIWANADQKGNYFIVFCNQKTPDCLAGVPINDDDTFYTNLEPGKYKISINPYNGNEALGWYATDGLASSITCGDVFSVQAGQEATITIDLHPIACSS